LLVQRSPPRAPHVASFAPWRDTSNGVRYYPDGQHRPFRPSTPRPIDHSAYENPKRLRFLWEAGARQERSAPSTPREELAGHSDITRNADIVYPHQFDTREERSTFPAGNSVTEPDADHNLHQIVNWNLLTEHPPLSYGQVGSDEQPLPDYSSQARATIAVLLQRAHDEDFYADLDLRVMGDVYGPKRKFWHSEQFGNTLASDTSLVFNPRSAPWGDKYIVRNARGQVDREQMARWSLTRDANRLVLL
jgi:hypothetical protein